MIDEDAAAILGTVWRAQASGEEWLVTAVEGEIVVLGRKGSRGERVTRVSAEALARGWTLTRAPAEEVQPVEANAKLPRKRRRGPWKWCAECGAYPADPPSTLCPGCEAYREHQS